MSHGTFVPLDYRLFWCLESGVLVHLFAIMSILKWFLKIHCFEEECYCQWRSFAWISAENEHWSNINACIVKLLKKIPLMFIRTLWKNLSSSCQPYAKSDNAAAVLVRVVSGHKKHSARLPLTGTLFCFQVACSLRPNIFGQEPKWGWKNSPFLILNSALNQNHRADVDFNSNLVGKASKNEHWLLELMTLRDDNSSNILGCLQTGRYLCIDYPQFMLSSVSLPTS